MRAIQFDAYGGPEVLRLRQVERPALRAGHVLVRTIASSVNAGDTLVRSGKLRLLAGSRFPRGAGFDFTGDVAEVASDVRGFQVGDPVWGFLNGLRQGPLAAVADYVAVSAKWLARRPRTVDAVSAAALAGAGGATLGILRDSARLRAGERVLVRGAAGGVGVAAVQIARSMGAYVVGLVRGAHVARVCELGAHEAFDYRSTDPSTLGSFDVIVDPVARDLSTFRRLLAPRGRMIAMTLGGVGEAAFWIVSAVFGGRRVRFIGKPPDAALLAGLTELVDAKSVSPIIERVYEMDQISEAHRDFEAGGGFGKRVIRIRAVTDT